MRLLKGLTSPLANRGPSDIDMVCVRENSEGEYAGLGGRIHVGTPHEAAEQTGLFTRHGIERIKQDVPVWKKETLTTGESEWVMGS